MSIKLRELIRSIRACKTAAEERAVITRECALIRTAFKEDDNQFRHRNVAKLLFIHMMGYPTHFGQMECLKLIASAKFPEKRVGYLGLTQLLAEDTEVLMLVTNSIKNDMNHDNQFVNGLALCAMGNIASPEMCRVLAREVEQLLTSSNPYVRKKAALCTMRIVRKVEEIEDKFNHRIVSLLDDRDHGVLLSGCSLLTTLLEVNPDYIQDFRRHVNLLVGVLRKMTQSGYKNAADYDVAGITDPFLQSKILRLLRILGKGNAQVSDEINDTLAQVATNTDGSKNTGNAILYECVLTIMSIEAESGLRVLGINILGRFLLSNDNNIRYVALATLQRVIAVDIKAVQRHRGTIIDCLKDNDISIRRRALDVTYALVNDENIKNMTKELLNYLLVADTEFKQDLCSRICLCVEKFSPNKRWQIDTLIKVMCLAGNYVQEEARENFCRTVAGTKQLWSYTAHKLYFSMKESSSQEALVHCGVWCLGEFGDLLVSGRAVGPDSQPIHINPQEVLDLLQDIIKKPPTVERSHITHALVSSALVKLVTRCPTEAERIKKQLQKFESHISVDLQQRSCEFLEVLGREWDSTRAGILDRMPVSEKEADSRPSGDTSIDEVPSVSSSGAPASRGGGGGGGGPSDLLDLTDLLDNPAPAAAPQQQQAPAASMGGGDLLDLLDTGPAAPAPAQQAAPATVDSGLMDIFGGGGGGMDPLGMSAPAAALAPVLAWEKNGLKIVFNLEKQPDFTTKCVATFSNSTDAQVTNFVMEAAVPKYLKLSLQPATGAVLEPRSSNVTQTLLVQNTTQGKEPIRMKLRIGYSVNGMPAQDMAAVGNFPPGL